jgi:hypothetical protein
MITELEPIWVGVMPTTFEAGKLNISRSFDTAIHLCVCGCGMHTVTPLGGDGWPVWYAHGWIGEFLSIYSQSMWRTLLDRTN